MIFSSGDSGVGAGDCTNDKGKKFFEPAFPASCPFVCLAISDRDLELLREVEGS